MAEDASEASEAGLKTLNVFLDTEVYRRFGHNLNSKVLQAFLKQITDHGCKLHITDITLSEIKYQIEEMATEVAQAANKSNRALKRWHQRSKWNGNFTASQQDIDAGQLAKSATADFAVEVATGWRAKTHKSLDIPAKDIFESYFRRDPPFDRVDSKEFPDAFVVAALDRWCSSQHQRMYVITKDAAMLRAVERTKTLIPLPTIESFLEKIVEAQHPEALKKAQEIFNSPHWEDTEDKIRDGINSLGTVYTGSLQDGEISDHSVADDALEIIDYKVISVSGEQIEIVTKIRVPINFEVQYLDITSGWYDPEEEEYIGAEISALTFKRTTTIRVLIAIDSQNNEVTDIDVLTQDLYLEEPYEDFK